MVGIGSLKAAKIFEGLSEQELELIAAYAREERREAGDVLTREGGGADKLYILLDGAVALKITHRTEFTRDPETVTISQLTRYGEVIGWSALVDPHLYTVTAECVRPSWVIAIDARGLRGMLESRPAIGYGVMKGIARVIRSRLRDTARALVGERLTGFPNERDA